jgi:HEAT repeat protein
MGVLRKGRMEDRDGPVVRFLKIIQTGSRRKLFAILPHITVTRSPLFLAPLLKLLRCRDRYRQEFAALALGAQGYPSCVEPLWRLFQDESLLRGPGSQRLQAAVIFALGDTGLEEAVSPLISIYTLVGGQGDRFAKRRKRLVLSALGALAQQSCPAAERELIHLCRDNPDELGALAISELTVAYWHRPKKIPDTVLQEIVNCARQGSPERKKAALSGLSNLADLGCPGAERFFDF